MSNGDIPPGEKVAVKNLPTADSRLTQLANLYFDEFQIKPNFFVRVPGRVNLIGEHVDYCGYPVLPMALEQDILVAVGSANDAILSLRNVNKKYVSFDCKLTTSDDVQLKSESSGKPYWYNYVLCGIKGAMEHVGDNFSNGLRLIIDGNIPPASGLSSSSALVSAACLSFLHAQGMSLEKSDIASMCARSERYIGTEGGGMDQAIAFLAKKGCAQYITWQPLRATSIELPEDAVFVVAHSLAEANKAATNDFNRRVIECRLAAKILAKLTGIKTVKNIITLSEVQKALGKELYQMPELVKKCIPLNIYSRNEVCKALEIDDHKLSSEHLTENTKHMNEFKLQQRAIHVYEEAIRVEEFRKTCMQLNNNQNGMNGIDNGEPRVNGHHNGDIKPSDVLETLGRLMRKSHSSLQNLYECSHPNLDRLVQTGDKISICSRLTGAGWGGCIVALCPRHRVDEYVDLLKKEFYDEVPQIKDVQHYVFATKPNQGAEIYLNK